MKLAGVCVLNVLVMIVVSTGLVILASFLDAQDRQLGK